MGRVSLGCDMDDMSSKPFLGKDIADDAQSVVVNKCGI